MHSDNSWEHLGMWIRWGESMRLTLVHLSPVSWPLIITPVWFVGIPRSLGGHRCTCSWHFNKFGAYLVVSSLCDLDHITQHLCTSVSSSLKGLFSSIYNSVSMTFKWEQKCLSEFVCNERKPLWSWCLSPAQLWGDLWLPWHWLVLESVILMFLRLTLSGLPF